MADDRLRFILDFVAQTAGLKNAQELAEQLGTELTDAEDAGKQMAAALKAAADKADRELAETVALADKLGQALGPELTARVNVDEIASKMRQVGMTTADVEANIDDFRSSLTKMADTADQAKARMGDLDDGVRRVGDSTDRSRSVMANFTGNAMQELPMLSGAFGPLNMAIGQFAEYAAEGNISLKKFATTGALIGGVALLMSQIGNNAAYAKQHADSLRSAIENMKSKKFVDAAESLVGAYEQFYKQGPKMGATAADITNAILGNEEAYQRVIAAVTAYRDAQEVGSQQWIGADATLTQYTARLSDAQREYAAMTDSTTTMGVATDEVAQALARASSSTGEVATAADKAKRRIELLGAEWDKFTDKFDKENALANAVLSVEGLDDALADIQARLDSGEISGAEAWAESVLAVNGVKGALHDLLVELGVTSTKFAEGIDVLIDTGQIDEAYAKLLALQALQAANNAPGARQGEAARNGHQPWTPQAETPAPVVVQSTTVLEVNGRAVQEITTMQTEQARGSR